MSAPATNRRRQWCGSAGDRKTAGRRDSGYDSFDDVKRAAHRHLMETDEEYAAQYEERQKQNAERRARRARREMEKMTVGGAE